MRTIIMTGRLAADAEKKCSKNGREFISFRFANSEFNEKDKEGKPVTYWFRCTSFQPNHFGMLQWLKKGKPVILTGRYSDSIYQTKNGTWEISRDVIVDTIEFISDGNDNNSGDAAKAPRNGETTTKTTTTEIPQVTNGGQPVAATPEPKAPEVSAAAKTDDFDDDLPF